MLGFAIGNRHRRAVGLEGDLHTAPEVSEGDGAARAGRGHHGVENLVHDAYSSEAGAGLALLAAAALVAVAAAVTAATRVATTRVATALIAG